MAVFGGELWYPTRSVVAEDSLARPMTLIATKIPLYSRDAACRFNQSADQPRGSSALGRKQTTVSERSQTPIRTSSYVRSYDGTQREFHANTVATGSRNGMAKECWADDIHGSHEKLCSSSLDALTKAEFRRLKDQIRDVSASLGYKFRGCGYKKYLKKDEPNPILYRSQLAESMKTFRVQSRPTLQPEVRKTELTRCRPIIGTKPICERPSTAPAAPESLARPISARPPGGEVDQTTVRTYDSLHSAHIYDLAARDTIDSGYGDVSVNVIASEDDNSDCYDNSPEPPIITNIEIPEFNLRPEPMESMYISEGELDYEKYNFDATQVEIPPYDYRYCGPESFEKVDFEDLASYGRDWRFMTKRRPDDPNLESLIDRYIEMERLVANTEDWEERQREKCRSLTRQKQIHYHNLRSQGKRVASAKSRDKKCCGNCLQQACTGDCPLKKASVKFCLHCRQEFCNGRCVHLTYNSFSRLTASESDSEDEEVIEPRPKSRPKSCQTCRRQDTNVKVLNSNQLLQGRPKSSMATFSRATSCNSTKTLLESEERNVHSDIRLEFNRLNIHPSSRPSTASKRPRGRNAVVPGKSYFSQRHDSITVAKADRIKSAPPRLRRQKSRKGSRANSRPQTASKERHGT